MRSSGRDGALVAIALLALVLSLASLVELRPNEAPTRELLVPTEILGPIERVRALFGPTAESELVFVTAPPGEVLTDEHVAELEGAARGVYGVTRVWSARSRPRLTLVSEEPPTFALGPAPSSRPQAIDRLLRPSAREAAIWLVLDERTRLLGGARRFAAELDAALGSHRRDGETLRAVGSASRRVASWEIAERDGRRTLPWLLAAVVVVPLLFFRSIVAVLFPLLIAGLSTGVLLAAYRAVHGRLDPWALVLVPIVWSVATMDALHLYEGASGAGGDARREVALPALVTAGTTALGLSTLAFPGSPPMLRTFGLWGALGTLLAYGFTFGLGGALLRVFPVRPIPPASRRLVRRIVTAARRRPAPVLAVWAVVALVGGLGMTRLRVEPSYRHTFAPGTEAGAAWREAERAVDADLAPLEIYLEARTPRARHPAGLVAATLGLSDYLATLPETRLTLSASTLLSEWTETDPRARRFVGDPTLLAQIQDRIRPLTADPLVAEWLRLDRGVSRTEVLLRPTSYARMDELLTWIDRYLATNAPGYRVTFGGPSYLEHAMEREGLGGIAWGTVTDFVLLGAILVVLLRRGRLVLTAVLGNVVPVVAVLGAMGLAGLPWSFDLLGLPILVLGLAIDDTIHLLWPLRGAPARQLGSRLHRSIGAYGVAVSATAILLATSLAGLSLSGFGVNHELGVLFPAGLVVGLAAELTLVPAVLARRRRSARTISGSRA